MDKIQEIKQDTADTFYNQMRDGRSFLDNHILPGETTFFGIGGWPIGSTGNMYRDWKAFQFIVTAAEHKMDHPVWLNAEQARRKGYYIRKGETSKARVERTYEDGKTIIVPMFNGSQISGLQFPTITPVEYKEQCEKLDKIIQDYLDKNEQNISYDDMSAPWYDRINDVINIAPKGAYKNSNAHRGEYYEDMFRLIAQSASNIHRANVPNNPSPNSIEGSDERTMREITHLNILREEIIAAHLATELRIGYRPTHQEIKFGQTLSEVRPCVEKLEMTIADANKVLRYMNFPTIEREPIPDREALKPTVVPGTEETARVASEKKQTAPVKRPARSKQRHVEM